MKSLVTNDDELSLCTQTELIQIARRQGLPPLRKSIPKDRLVQIVSGIDLPRADEISGTAETRRLLEGYIKKHWGVVRSQLPQCTGQCTRFPCTEGRHATCFSPNAERVISESVRER